MTPEEFKIKKLLTPRIKCAARYPDSPFPVGAVLEQDFEEPEIYNYIDSNRRPWMIENPELYPDVFTPIPWWKDRKPEDMPEYVKDGRVFKIIKWTTVEDAIYYDEIDKQNGCVHFYMKNTLPATEAEYNAYINQQH